MWSLQSKRGTHPAVHVEDAIRVVNADRMATNYPFSEKTSPCVNLQPKSPKKQKQLDDVITEEPVPEPAARGLWTLKVVMNRSDRIFHEREIRLQTDFVRPIGDARAHKAVLCKPPHSHVFGRID